MTGEVISHFEILETLGEGGMGVVYKARDTKLDRTVAIKLLPRRMLTSDLDRERFSLEARAAANLSHPNICTVFEYDDVDGQALIAMECIEGPNLKDRIEDGALSLADATGLIKQIASGLHAAHAKGIVHRDIKPANVLLTEEGAVKISDFGLAKLVGGTAMTQTGVSLGTIAYMSPEQTRGDEVGPPTDIWALGAVFHQMLTGSLPFPHSYPTAIMYAIVNEEPEALDLIEQEHGASIADLVRRCLNKDPSERPTAAEIVEMLGGESTTGQIVFQSVSAPARKVPWKAAAVVIAITAILGVAIMLLPEKEELPDLTEVSVAVLPLGMSSGQPGVSAPDSSLRLTLDGLLQTVSNTIEGAMKARGLGNVIPFRDIIDLGVMTAEEAAGKLGADYAVASRIEGYDPVPTLAFTLLEEGGNQVGQSIAVPILLDDLQDSYEAALTRLGGLLGIADSVLLKPSGVGRPTTPEVLQLYTRAMGLLQQRSSLRSLDAAEGQLDRAVELDPEFAAGHAALGKTDLFKFEATRDLSLLDEAERHCDNAIRLEPDLIEAYVTLGAVFANTGKPGQAQRALETALNREPFNTGALLALAEVKESLGEYEEAEQTYKRAIESSPNYWGAYNRLGKFYVGRSEWQKAADQYQRVVDLAPSNSIGYRNLGSMMWYLGRIDEARKSWELSLEIEPSYSIYSNLGTMHFYEKNYAAAAAAYEQALKINDKDHRVWGNLATAYFWMKANRSKYLQAIGKAAQMAEEALKMNPSDLEVKSELAGYYSELGDMERAKAVLQEFGVEPDPEISSHISFEVGAAWEMVGNRDRALTWIDDALKKGYTVTEVAEYPGLEALRADPAFVRIMRSLPTDSRQ